MNKFIPIGVVVVIAIAIWVAVMSGQKVQNQPADGYRTYATTTFSVSYPPGYIVDEAYRHDITPGVVAYGVKFTIDPTMASGTNLSTDSGVAVETIPTLHSCNAGAYLDGEHKVVQIIEDGKAYLVATSTGAGAGNFYEEWAYVRRDNAGPCPAVHYIIHTTNIGNYPAGTVTEYDRAKLLEEFDKIRLSLETK